MKSELVWITPHAQSIIVHIARVSNPKSQEAGNNPARLIKYLIKHRHWSPFEMASACFEVNTTRDIARQIIRHWSFKFEEEEFFHIQEFSQRYADPTKELGFVFREARMQDANNRQSSIECDDAALQAEWREWQRMVQDLAAQAYRWAIDKGIAKEVARAPLPEGMTPSRIYMAAPIRSWMHYCAVRTDPGTQKEHREIAEEIWTQLVDHMPAISIAREILAKDIAADIEAKQKANAYPLPLTVGFKGTGAIKTEADIAAEEEARAKQNEGG